jgi:hypothetical protein
MSVLQLLSLRPDRQEPFPPCQTAAYSPVQRRYFADGGWEPAASTQFRFAAASITSIT